MFKKWIFLFTSCSLYALTTLEVQVSTDNDPGGQGNEGDLRHCLNTMNTDLNMAPDDYVITFAFPMTIQLNGILPIINNSSNSVNITIGNSGSIPTVTIDGNSGAFSGLFIPIGNVTIQNMIFQNLTAKGGTGGNGNSGGGGGLGAGGAIYAPHSFLNNGSSPSITLMNVEIDNCSAVGGNGGSYNITDPTGNEGGGGGGGFSGNGGSITTHGVTGGAGGGGFGGNGGDVTFSTDDARGGGGGGGGGLGSQATIGTLTNLGNGGSDADLGSDGNGYGLTTTAGSGGGGYTGGSYAGGGAGGNAVDDAALSGGGGGGGSAGMDGVPAKGTIPPGGGTTHSGGDGGDGGGGGGGGVVITDIRNEVDGHAGSGGYGGGGGGGAGTGASDIDYTVEGGAGGLGGGGGGGGANQSGETPAGGGNSLGGGGGGGGGPSNGSTAMGGTDMGNLGGGSGGEGANTFGPGSGGGGGGGGSGLGGAIFVDSNSRLTLQAFSGIPTTFNTSNNTTQAGTHGTGGPGATDGFDGSALGNNIFLRAGSSLTLLAQDTNDLLILGDQVSFTDDTSFGTEGTNVNVRGNGTVVYNGTTDYQGTIMINNANFKVNGLIDEASVLVCRNVGSSSQRGTLSGTGTLTGNVFVNSGTISPDTGETLSLGSLTLSPANPGTDTLGSLVHIEIDADGTSLVSIAGPASLAGMLEIELAPNALPGTYNILTSTGITGTFDAVSFTGTTPSYSLAYLPIGTPTFVQFDFLGFASSLIPTTGLSGNALRIANYLNDNGSTSALDLLNGLSGSTLSNALNSISPARNSFSNFIEAETAFFLSQIVNDHKDQMRFSQRKPTHAPLANLVADASDTLCFPMPRERETWAAWIGGFLEYAHVDASLQNPAFHFLSDGVLLGLDYYGGCHEFIGGALGYTHNHFNDEGGMGHGQINTYFASLYGNVWIQNIYLSPTAWGVFNQSDQKRLIAFEDFSEIANANIFSWLFVPHLEIGYVETFQCYEITPFASLDWVISWQRKYTENGASVFNAEQDANTSSMLRGEIGLKLWEKWQLNYGIFSLREKVSYVCEKPFGIGTVNAAFVGMPNSFTVVAVQQTLNLGTVGLDLIFSIGQKKTLDVQLGYEGEFGSSYWSNQGVLSLTQHF